MFCRLKHTGRATCSWPDTPLSELGSLKRRVHIQVCHDNMSGVNKLLEIGGSIDVRDSAQRTLLHRACEEVSSLVMPGEVLQRLHSYVHVCATVTEFSLVAIVVS